MSNPLKYIFPCVMVGALMLSGCGRDSDDETAKKPESGSPEAASVKDFLPPAPAAGSVSSEDIKVAEVELPAVAAAREADVPELPPEVVAKAGVLIDQTVSEMQDLTLVMMEIKDLDGATEAAPQITDKVKALHAINEESKVLGVSEDQGRKYFPQKYATLKQMSALIQAYSQKISHDVNIYRIVTDAWTAGQGPVEEGFLESRAEKQAQEETEAPDYSGLPGEEPKGEPERKRLREYR